MSNINMSTARTSIYYFNPLILKRCWISPKISSVIEETHKGATQSEVTVHQFPIPVLDF